MATATAIARSPGHLAPHPQVFDARHSFSMLMCVLPLLAAASAAPGPATPVAPSSPSFAAGELWSSRPARTILRMLSRIILGILLVQMIASTDRCRTDDPRPSPSVALAGHITTFSHDCTRAASVPPPVKLADPQAPVPAGGRHAWQACQAAAAETPITRRSAPAADAADALLNRSYSAFGSVDHRRGLAPLPRCQAVKGGGS